MGYQLKGIPYNKLHVGDKIYTASRTVTEADIVNFAGLSGDYNPLHTNLEYAKTTGYGGIIAHGALTFALSTGLVNQVGPFEGTLLGFVGIELKFTGAVKPGDTVTVVVAITEKRDTSKPDKGIVICKADVFNQKNQQVIDQKWTMLVKK